MDAKNKEIIEKLVNWRLLELQKEITDTNSDKKKIDRFKHEIDGIEKFGINAIGSSYLFFNAGNIVKLTIIAGDKAIERTGKILLFTDNHLILLDTETDVIFQVLKYNVIISELIELPSDDFHEFLENDLLNWEELDKNKGEHLYG